MARSTGLDPAVVDRLASDLADHAALRVPAALSGQVLRLQHVRKQAIQHMPLLIHRLTVQLRHMQMREDAPQRGDRVEYLRALLTRDPGVFLERHGEQLGKQDLQLFTDLRTDYEVLLSGVVLYIDMMAPTRLRA
jgi:hypothetical protein